MKASRRQQLRTNELAQTLADLKEFLRANSGAVAVGVAAVVLVVGLGIYWYSAKVASHRQGWTDLFGSQLAGSAKARLANLRAVAMKYKDNPVGAWAWLNYGDGALQHALSPGRPQPEQQRLVVEAAKAYETIISMYPDQALAVAGARFKLAGLAENRRQWDVARRHYRSIADDPRFGKLPQKQMAIEAEERLQQISQPVVFAQPPTSAPTTQTRPAVTSGPTGTRAATAKTPGTRPSSAPAK
jgi:hypothetical protein